METEAGYAFVHLQVGLAYDQQQSEKEHPWYYHRATGIDLTGDGRMSILTARARSPALGSKGLAGELCWLEMPKAPKFDPVTGQGFEDDGKTPFDPYSSTHAPWKLRKLTEGPDVMFSVGNFTGNKETVEVVAAQFFNQRVSLHEITVGKEGREPRVTFEVRGIDNGTPIGTK